MSLNISRATWFEKSVALFLLKEKENQKRHNGAIRGSSLGQCRRRIGYMLLGYERGPSDAHSEYIFNVGHAFHVMAQQWLIKMGLVKATLKSKDNNIVWSGNIEQNVIDVEYGITGHYDALTEPVDTNGYTFALDKKGTRYLIDFKTISNKQKTVALFLRKRGTLKKSEFYIEKHVVPPGMTVYSKDLPDLQGSRPKKLTDKGMETYLEMVTANNLQDGDLLDVGTNPGAFDKLTKPKKEHIYQTSFYADRLKADKIIVVYLAKDFDSSAYKEESILNIPIKAYEFDLSKEIVEEIQTRCDDIWNYIEKKKELSDNPEDWLPAREFSPTDIMSECMYCDYSRICHKDNPIAQRWFKSKVAERKLYDLPVLKSEPFITHSKEEFGKKALGAGEIKDE